MAGATRNMRSDRKVSRQIITANDAEISRPSVFAIIDVDIGRPEFILTPIGSWDSGLPIGTKIIAWRSILIVLWTFWFVEKLQEIVHFAKIAIRFCLNACSLSYRPYFNLRDEKSDRFSFFSERTSGRYGTENYDGDRLFLGRLSYFCTICVDNDRTALVFAPIESWDRALLIRAKTASERSISAKIWPLQVAS